MIVSVNNEIKKLLIKNSEFSELFLNNCINSKFLAIEKLNSEIIAACFVGGILNSNGIEIQNDSEMQLSFFSLDDKNFKDFKKQLESLDTDNLTPVEALVKLSELKKKITDND